MRKDEGRERMYVFNNEKIMYTKTRKIFTLWKNLVCDILL